jgi:hypothetical protein
MWSRLSRVARFGVRIPRWSKPIRLTAGFVISSIESNEILECGQRNI